MVVRGKSCAVSPVLTNAPLCQFGLLSDTVTEVRARPTLADVGNYVVIRFTVTVNENLEL